MTIHITQDNIEGFCDTLQAKMVAGGPVDLAAVAEASGTLQGPKVCFETPHFQIIDAGHDWKTRGYTSRFAMQRRPEFSKSRVKNCMGASSDVSAECLINEMNAAEDFHVRNAGYIGETA